MNDYNSSKANIITEKNENGTDILCNLIYTKESIIILIKENNYVLSFEQNTEGIENSKWIVVKYLDKDQVLYIKSFNIRVIV